MSHLSLGSLQISPAYYFRIPEDAIVGTKVVGPVLINAEDPEGRLVTYTLLDASSEDVHNAPFGLVEANGNTHIQLQVGGGLDYERMPSYTLRVRASAGGSSSTAETFISIEDTDEPPRFYSDAARSIEQNTAYTVDLPSNASAQTVVSEVYIQDTEDRSIELLLVKGSVHNTPYDHSEFMLREVLRNAHYQLRVKDNVVLRERIVTLHLLLRGA